jgi:phosphatidylserine decarboxylase
MDYVKAVQRFGLIRFGSRLDVYIPSESRIAIKVRDRVKAGETVIGYLP